MLSDDVAVVTIQSGKKKANPRFIRMTSWELTIRGEGEPVSEFIPSAADVMGIGDDGSVSMRIPTGSSTGAFLKTIPPEKIKRLVVEDAWYLDDFGGVEDVVLEGLKGKGEAAPRAPDVRPSPRRLPAARTASAPPTASARPTPRPAAVPPRSRSGSAERPRSRAAGPPVQRTSAAVFSFSISPHVTSRWTGPAFGALTTKWRDSASIRT